MTESVCYGAIECECCSNANTTDHKAKLVDHAVSKYPSQVILDDCVEDREACHHCTDVNQKFGTGETACQCVHGNFGGEYREENSPCWCCFRIGIREPVVQQGECALDAEGQKYQPAADSLQADKVKCQRTGLIILYQCAGE